MPNIQLLEAKYLDAKVAYYSGNPTMSDSAFDALEQILKKENSKVIKQVGMKRSDFDFPHPSPMLSLDKRQTEETVNGIDYKEDEVIKWVETRCKKLRIKKEDIKFEFSPKYDGNAVNTIYIGGELHKILSRSDKDYGKDLTDKLKHLVPIHYSFQPPNDVLEIRYEAVLRISAFNKRYPGKANPRNMVAGILGRDELTDDLNDLELFPVCRLINGKYVENLKNSDFEFHPISSYLFILQKWIELRKTIDYQLDGMVISFPAEYRDKLGVNDHDLEFSLAIKFVPEEAISEILDIEWGVGKSGELTPVGILKPVVLAGTTVKRVSLYNVGNVINKQLGPSAIVSIQKSGDIIPEVKSVITPATIPAIIPSICPSCGGELDLNEIHLICPNPICKSKLVRLLDYHMKVLKLKGVGRATIDTFADQGFTIIDLIEFVRLNGNNKDDIEPYGFKYGSRSHKIFIDIFNNIKSIDFELIPILLGINDVGKKLSKLISLFYNGEKVNFANQERALVELLKKEETKNEINKIISRLECVGIEVIKPIKSKDMKTIKAELTGSPKESGWPTKDEFRKEFNVEETSLSNPDCEFLVTDDYHSTSNKMKTANKKGIEIITYSDFAKKFKK